MQTKTMKKFIFISAVVIVAMAITSCGSSRKTGCPAVAKSTNILSLKA
jgi:hypothetical protein